MTVRAWFTISAVVMVALVAAVALRLAAPTPAPTVVARVGSIRLPGTLDKACWPQRSGKNRCTSAGGRTRDTATVSRHGTIRIVVAYPVQPKEGSIVLRRTNGTTILEREWTRTMRYDLGPGSYELVTEARYDKAYLRYGFGFRVR